MVEPLYRCPSGCNDALVLVSERGQFAQGSGREASWQFVVAEVENVGQDIDGITIFVRKTYDDVVSAANVLGIAALLGSGA